MTEEMLDIADDATNDWALDKEGNPKQVHSEAVLRSKLRLETRQWLAARLDRQQRGDRQRIASGMPAGITRRAMPGTTGLGIIGKPRPRSPDGAVASSGAHHIPRPGG